MTKRDSGSITVCIPASNEDGLLGTLDSLASCETDLLIIRVLILINGSEKDSQETRKANLKTYADVQEWIRNYEGDIQFEALLDLYLPIRHAGVGLARKILGDKASGDFGFENRNGIIVYLDADCMVQQNYFRAISSFFTNEKHEAAAIHFEHSIEDDIKDRSIIEYELHLRYYILMQKYLDLPFAIHTVGSSMACLSDAYISKGGMSKRKAGEDFYFLQKFIKDGVCGNINETKVYPSSRKSDRVPFGTGRAMLKYKDKYFEWKTYNPVAFLILKTFLERKVDFSSQEVSFQNLNEGLIAYLELIDAKKNIENIKRNVASYDAFEKRFFQFFDAFKLMKYLHFLRDEYMVEDVLISDAVHWYFEEVLEEGQPRNLLLALNRLRN